jgi:hypothetical protein
VPTFEDDRWVATTASGVASQTPPAMQAIYVQPPKAKRRRGRVVAVVGIAAVGAALFVAAVTSGSGDRAVSDVDMVAVPKALPPYGTSTFVAPAVPTLLQPVMTAAGAGGGGVAGPPAPAPVSPPAAPSPVQSAVAAASVAPPPAPSPPQSVPEVAPAPRAPKRAQSVAGGSGGQSAPAGRSAAAGDPPKPGHARPVDPNAVLNPFD